VPNEREPNRYEPLNETHRRVAEEEEKRRLAEQERARSAAHQPEPEPFRPGTEPRSGRPETTPDHEPDTPEARLAEKERELQEQVRLGRINASEMVHKLRQFDNALRIEIEQGGRQPQPDVHSRQAGMSAEVQREGLVSQQRDDDRSHQPDRESRSDPHERVSDRRVEREAEAAEYEITGRGEMTDARAARLARLKGIDRQIERERQENKDKNLDRDRNPTNRSR